MSSRGVMLSLEIRRGHASEGPRGFGMDLCVVGVLTVRKRIKMKAAMTRKRNFHLDFLAISIQPKETIPNLRQNHKLDRDRERERHYCSDTSFKERFTEKLQFGLYLLPAFKY